MPTSLTSEILVNTVTVGDQTPQGLAVLRGGETVVSWLDSSSGASVAKVRVVGDDGVAVSGEIALGQASDAKVADLEGGGFVVAWISADGSARAVRAQVFDAGGNAVGAAKVLAAYDIAPLASLNVLGLDMIGLSDGGFAATWSEQRADAMTIKSITARIAVVDEVGMVDGEAATPVGTSSKALTFYDPHATLVELPDGHVLLTWHEAASNSGPSGQYAQRYDLDGVAVGSRIALDPAFPSDGGPRIDAGDGIAVEALANGQIAFAWGEVFVSLYPSAKLGQGNLTGRTQPLDIAGLDADGEPRIAALADGRFVVAWSSGGDVLAQILTSAGATQGAVFRLGDVSQGIQDLVDIAARPDGSLVAVWRDESHQGGDASGSAVKLQILSPADGQTGTAAVDVLISGAGNEVLAGQGGDDLLLSQAGADTLVGGAGSDKFIFSMGGGADRVLDFQSGVDHLLLFDAEGHIADGSPGLLIWVPQSHTLFWDPDSDAGAAPMEALAVLDGVETLSRADLAAGFYPSAMRILPADGTREEMVFDWDGRAFDHTHAVFTPQGAVISYSVINDDRSRAIEWFDDQSNQIWSSRGAQYDSADRLITYAVTLDNGDHTIWSFDPGQIQPWSRVVDEYDALGHILTRGVVSDDGSYWIATYDALNAQTWNAMVDHFDANGALTKHLTYFDDGSVV